MKNIPHIFDCIDWSTFPNKEADKELIGTRLSSSSLEVYYGEYHMTIERFIYIATTSHTVVFKDFTSNII